jgi:polyhydroxyalkanoate synthesis regulator phasin
MSGIKRIAGVAFVSIVLGGCHTTSQSVGTSGFQAALVACKGTPNEIACVKSHQNSANYTTAEWQLLAFTSMINEKVARGQITQSEGDYLVASAVNDAKATSDKAEAAQRRDMGDRLQRSAAALRSINPSPVQTSCMTTGAMTNCTTY